jgi:hypothetical protein
MVDEVASDIDWAKNKLDILPKAKKDLNPLLDAVSHKHLFSSNRISDDQ